MRSTQALWILPALLCVATLLPAHTQVNAPNGGEVMQVGDVFTIEWIVAIQHDTLNWDLFYSTVSDTGPWTDLALDLPVGDPTEQSVHSYQWTLPADAVGATVWIQVCQDNDTDQNYYDISDASFAVEQPLGPAFLRADVNGDLMLNIADAVTALNSLFGSVVLPCNEAADANSDGAVNIADPVYFLAYLFTSGSPPALPFPDCGTAPVPGALGCTTPACTP